MNINKKLPNIRYIHFTFIDDLSYCTIRCSFLCRYQTALAVLSQAASSVATVRLTWWIQTGMLPQLLLKSGIRSSSSWIIRSQNLILIPYEADELLTTINSLLRLELFPSLLYNPHCSVNDLGQFINKIILFSPLCYLHILLGLLLFWGLPRTITFSFISFAVYWWYNLPYMQVTICLSCTSFYRL